MKGGPKLSRWKAASPRNKTNAEETEGNALCRLMAAMCKYCGSMQPSGVRMSIYLFGYRDYLLLT